jgi:hypothetical protein
MMIDRDKLARVVVQVVGPLVHEAVEAGGGGSQRRSESGLQRSDEYDIPEARKESA